LELEKLKSFISELMSVDINSITENTRFFADLGMDSLDVFQLVAEAEAYFGVHIPDAAAKAVKTIGDAVNLIAGK